MLYPCFRGLLGTRIRSTLPCRYFIFLYIIYRLSFCVPPICVYTIAFYLFMRIPICYGIVIWTFGYLFIKFLFEVTTILFYIVFIRVVIICVNNCVVIFWNMLIFLLFNFVYTYRRGLLLSAWWAPRGQCFWFVRIKLPDHSRSKRY